MEQMSRARTALPVDEDRRLQVSAPRHAESGRAPAPLKAVPGRDNFSNGFVEDRFVERDGMRYAGTHLIVDLWQASGLDDAAGIDAALRRAAAAAGATLLGVHLHSFAPTGGVTGVALLAESHISIHTWPESAYAAVDLFMCGSAEPHKAIAVLREAFRPGQLTVTEHKRGLVP